MSSLQQVLQAAVGRAYQIQKELPGAGMSRVFLAREPALSRDVVVKVLPPDLLSTSSLQRFTREVEVTARLQHPYILPIITAGGTDDLRYYVTPFIGGESLRARLASGDPIPFADVVRMGDQLLSAVAFAHGRGVIHRDIKPGNVLISEGHAVLADFGIAAIVKGEQPTDHVDQVTGSTLDSARIYVAPEQPRDEARDLFATAVVIHEMVTGTPGVAGLSSSAIMGAIRARHPDASLSDTRKLAAILCRALSTDPTARYATANELRGAIHSIGRGSRQMATLVAIAGAAALVVGAVVTRQRPSATPVTPTPILRAPADTPASRELEQQGAIAGLPTAAPAETVKVVPAMSLLDSARFLSGMGDLGGAMTLYREAARADESDSRAQLGLAITTGMTNSPAEVEASRTAAQRALAGSPALDAHDRALAEGYVALADRRYPDACAAFERARQARASFEAWFGLGECRTRDDAIVFDAQGAPSFRSSSVAAFDAYVSAARSTAHPSSIVYRRMVAAVPQTSADVRVGRAPDGRTFAGKWSVVNDTFGFVMGLSAGPRIISPEIIAGAADAAKVGREKLRPLLLDWVRQAPADPTSHEMYALLLETMGNIATVGDDKASAIGEITAARKLEKNPLNALRLAGVHGRLLLRAGRHEELARLADSVLSTNTNLSSGDAEPMLPLALLTGRVARATDILTRVSGTTGRAVRGADGRPVELSPAIIAERSDFLVRASLGICDARVRNGPKRMVDLLDAAFPGGVPRGVEPAFLERILVQALPCTGPGVTATLHEPGRLFLSWVRAFDPNDTSFPAEYQARARRQTAMPAGEAAMDVVIVDALAQLAMKDSVGALKALTLGLDRLPLLTRGVFSSEWNVGATVRGMVLTADLAAALGERETAHRWASAVAALWRNADRELQPTVDRMRDIAVKSDDRE